MQWIKPSHFRFACVNSLSRPVRYICLMFCLAALVPDSTLAQSAAGRIYVERIEFLETDRINDNVLRREMLQFEGTYLNAVALEKSRLRLERLVYVESAKVALRPIAGKPDVVDVLITIKDAPARRYGGGGGWSESLRASVHGYFVNENLLGTGQRFSARVDVGEFRTDADLSHTDPYAHASGVSRTLGLALHRSEKLTADTSDLESNLISGRLQYQYKVGERQSVRFGLTLQDTELIAGPSTSTQLQDWVATNGNPGMSGNSLSTDYLNPELLFGWHYDTRDQLLFPTSGTEQSLGLNFAIPGVDVGYFTLSYELSSFWTLNSGWTAKFGTRLGYGAAYGSNTSSLPPHINWFAGGPNTVRGYRENRLGPRDSLGNPYGGNLHTSAQVEILMPLPEKWKKRVRIGFFYDVGNVFSTEDVNFQDDSGQVLDYGFNFSELRHSAGISAKYVLPIGVLGLSYGIPLNADDENPNRFLRDDVKRFQVTIGVNF